MHISLTDDFALECGSECHGDGQLGHLDLNVPQFQRGLDGLVVIADGNQCAGNLILSQIDVHDDGEAQSNGACTGRNHHSVDGTEGVDKGGNAVLGVIQQTGQISGLDVAEDQSSTDRNSDDMDDGGHIMAQRNDAQFQAHLDAAFGALLDNITDQEGHDALGLVVLTTLTTSSALSALPRTTATPGISPVTSGTPRERMMGSGTKPMPDSFS